MAEFCWCHCTFPHISSYSSRAASQIGGTLPGTWLEVGGAIARKDGTERTQTALSSHQGHKPPQFGQKEELNTILTFEDGKTTMYGWECPGLPYPSARQLAVAETFWVPRMRRIHRLLRRNFTQQLATTTPTNYPTTKPLAPPLSSPLPPSPHDGRFLVP